MRHEEDGRLMAYVDGELAPDEARVVETHVGGCPECALSTARLRSEKGRVRTVLTAVDRDPSAASRRVRERLGPLGAAAPVRRRVGAAPPRRWLLRTRALQAALFVLFLAGGAAALVPGSPLRRWLEGGGSGLASNSEPALMRGTEEAAPTPEPVTLSALPAEGRLRIVLSLPAGTELRVVPVEGERATVSANPDTDFGSAPGVLEATVSAGPVRVELPRGAADASLEVNGELYVRAQGGEVRFTAPAADSSDAEVSFRIRGP